MQPDIIHVGGIMEAEKIAAIADASYTPVSFHNPFGPVATAAALQLDACTTNVFMQESFCGYSEPWRFDLLEHALRPVEGRYRLSDLPGLGVGEFQVEAAAGASVRPQSLPADVERGLARALSRPRSLHWNHNGPPVVDGANGDHAGAEGSSQA